MDVDGHELPKKNRMKKPRVLITRQILPEALEYLSNHVDFEIGATDGSLTNRQEIIEKIRDKEGLLSLLVDEIDSEVMDAAPDLKIIANCAVGYNNIDVNYAKEKGIMITNTPGVLTDTTADLSWALILAVARRIPEADRFVRQGRFSGWELDLLLGKEITRKRLGIIGMGRIGKAVAMRAQAFCMDTVYVDPHPLKPEEEEEHQASYLPFKELLSSSDIVTLHTTLTEETYHLISEKELQTMKESAILVNVSRGPVVDERALVKALKQGQIWGAGLDVYEREPEIEEQFFAMDNVVLLPHVGSASYDTRLKMAMTAATNLVQGLSGQKPDNLV